ncbi:MAG: ATP-grasp domain-containing protein [Oscillospiraceae bacterium]|nr:ATP-grasp domain-containing protein [Candidatus Equicaccousia limihippi]
MKTIFIVGAGFLQSFVIKKAKEMGYYTVTADLDKNAIGFKYADDYAIIDIVNKEACLDFAKKHNIDGVLTAATEYGVLTTSYIAGKLGLPGLKYESAQRIKNKYSVRRCLFENNVDDMESAYEINGTTDISALANKITYPVIVKPCDGSGSRGTSRVDSPDTFENACNFAMNNSISHTAEAETFISGNEYGAECIVIDGEIYVLAIMKKFMTVPPFYAELGHTVPCGLTDSIEAKAKQCVADAIRALDINFGSVNADMIITDEGKVYIVDIGTRMGGNMIGPCIVPYGTGIDYMSAMIENAFGDFKGFKKTAPTAVATKLLAFDGGTVKKIPDMKDISLEYDVEIYHHIQQGMTINRYQTNLDGCGYIIAKDSDVAKAEKKAANALEEIKNHIFDC